MVLVVNNLLSKYLFYYPITLLHGEFIGWHLRNYENIQWKSKEEIRDYQSEKLSKLVRHAYDTSYYYQSLLRNRVYRETILIRLIFLRVCL